MKLAVYRRVLLLVRLFLSGLVLAIALTHAPATAQTEQRSPAADRIGDRIAEIERTWQRQYESYFDIDSDATPLSAAQIDATLSRLGTQTGKRMALIYMFPRPQSLELVLVIPGQAPVLRSVPTASRQNLARAVSTFQSRVVRLSSGRGAYLASARQLYQWLIAPIEPDLRAQSIETLLLCVGQSLRSLPFAALHDGRQFLIEKYSLGLIPAFSLTNTERDRWQNTQVLAMGASEFQGLNALPAVPLELSSLVRNHWRGRTFLNQEFTLNNLRQELETGDFGIVHLATHAEFRPGSPQDSFIQLWQRERLTLDRVAQLAWSKLPVELLVLSGCRTALGDAEAELGFAGLAFHAGAKTTLASLWYVSDIGTLALMQEFYRQLAQPGVSTKAEALRRAQIALLRGEVAVQNGQLRSPGGDLPLPEAFRRTTSLSFASPYYWGAFTLVGSTW